MAGSPNKRARRARWQALKANPDFARQCIARIACGDSIRALAAENDIPINTFWHWITKEHGEELKAARQAAAAVMADRMLELAEQVEAGEVDPKAARSAASIRQWLASRYDRETFGDKTKVEMTATVQQQHLEALRQLGDVGDQ